MAVKDSQAFKDIALVLTNVAKGKNAFDHDPNDHNFAAQNQGLNQQSADISKENEGLIK